MFCVGKGSVFNMVQKGMGTTERSQTGGRPVHYFLLSPVPPCSRKIVAGRKIPTKSVLCGIRMTKYYSWRDIEERHAVDGG